MVHSFRWLRKGILFHICEAQSPYLCSFAIPFRWFRLNHGWRFENDTDKKNLLANREPIDITWVENSPISAMSMLMGFKSPATKHKLGSISNLNETTANSQRKKKSCIQVYLFQSDKLNDNQQFNRNEVKTKRTKWTKKTKYIQIFSVILHL